MFMKKMRLSEAFALLAYNIPDEILELLKQHLNPGLKYPDKNRYFSVDGVLIVELTQGEWMLADDIDRVREILSRNSFCYNGDGYARSNAGYFHRLLLDSPEGYEIDHINRNKADNRLENLRCVTHVENCKNRSRRKDNKTGVPGVSYHSSKDGYEAYIYQDGRRISKSFSCKQFGRDKALRLAIAWRREREQELGYSGE
jgi:hypothetical protein